jgi:chemotaxis protein CheZ
VNEDQSAQDLLEKLRNLVAYLEAGDEDQAKNILDELANTRETYLFQEVGKLTRRLHDTLNNFQLDTRLAGIASTDIPDAKERLNYVINMTEQSANRTLGAIEDSIPILDGVEDKISQVKDDWGRFIERKMPLAEFRTLSKKITEMLDFIDKKNPAVKNNLNEVLMAQEFQDLTSQVIRKVITLVEDLEESLVTLIKISGGVVGESKTQSDKNELSGPAVPGTTTGDSSITNQDDVDDLLSSLGF